MRYKEFITNENFTTLLKGLTGSGQTGLSAFTSLANPDDDTSSSASGSDSSSTNTQQSGTNVPSGLPVNAPITSKFGFRTSVGKAHNHNGTDFAVPIGTPVKAPQAGIVQSTGFDKGAGNFVVIDSGGVIHKLFHLSKSTVQSGQRVKAGDVVGLSGNTGYSTGPHLHWEKHIAGRPVDPMSNVG